jgi:enoyl-[acyl-carrier protein] reductase/trans-2-enoyl-CoA reductase (NAD+)
LLIEPKIRNNICLTAHPVGCALQVRDMIHSTRKENRQAGPRAALIIGASNGYGMGSRVVAAFGYGASTLGIAYERPAGESKLGTAGYYNDRGFLQYAAEVGLPAWSINGDAFADEIKREALELIRRHLGPLDLVVYSIAAPRRLDPVTGTLHSSVIKPIGRPYTARTVDFQSGDISTVSMEPATEREIADTVKVMGGEDWRLWIEALRGEGLLAPNALTVAFSYIGPAFTAPIYREGTIGRAKEDLEATAGLLDRELSRTGGRALVSVNKALVTRASAVIPAVPLYIAMLYRVMKRRGLHESCLQQSERLFSEFLYSGGTPRRDADGRIRLDDREMREEVQAEVAELLEQVNEENLERISDIAGFREEFLLHHGFGRGDVDYSAEVSP